MEQRRFHHKLLVAALLNTLVGCGAVQVTDGSGTTQPIGQWLESWKPANAKAQTASKSSDAGDVTSAGSVAEEWPANRGCRVMENFALGTDVDTAYARSMRKFALSTAEQMQRLRQERTDVIVDARFRHDRAPGAHYHFAQRVKYLDGAGLQRAMWLDVSLSKEVGQSFGSAKYCLLGNEAEVNAPPLHQFVQRYIVAALTTAK